jgi:hypothetical protein
MLANCASITRIAGAFAVSLLFASTALVNPARADDEYGSNHEIVILHSAASASNRAPAAAPSTSLADAYGAGQAPLAEPKAGPQLVPGGSRLASEAPMGVDLVGQGGPQDELARKIYHTGTSKVYWTP